MGLKFDLFIMDSKNKVKIPYDEEMKTYIEIKFVQTIHKANEAVTKKIFAAGPCPSNWHGKLDS